LATAQEIIAGLTQRGLPLHVAQGIAGNMFAESGYDTGVNEAAPIVPGSRGGFGLNQWTGPRRRAIEAEAQRRGVPVSDLGFQLDYTMHELQGPERGAYGALMETSSPTEAARVYSERFLRPGIPHMDRRVGEAARLAGIEYTPGANDMATRSNQQPMANQGISAAVGGQQEQRQGGIRGLLDMFRGGQQQGGQERPSMWANAPFGLDDEDRRARLAMALEGMTLNPNQQMIESLGRGITDRREAAQQAQGRNATAEWLRSQGRDDLAELVTAGGLPGTQAMNLAASDAQRQASAGAPRPLEIREVGSAIYGIDPISGEARILAEGRAGFRAANPDEIEQYGTMGQVDTESGRFYPVDPPAGMSFTVSPDGTVQLTQGPQAEADAMAAEQADRQRSNQAGVVVEDIDRAIDIVQNAEMPATGAVGALMSNVPGTSARDLNALLDTIGANIAFDTLAAMRAASPTGGALGAISERELALLQATRGSIAQSQTQEQFLRNLGRLRTQFAAIANGTPPSGYTPGQWASMPAEQRVSVLSGADPVQPQGSGSNGLSDDELLMRYGGN